MMVKNRLLLLTLLIASQSALAYQFNGAVSVVGGEGYLYKVDTTNTNNQLYDIISSVINVPKDQFSLFIMGIEIPRNDAIINEIDLSQQRLRALIKRPEGRVLPVAVAMPPVEAFILSVRSLPTYEERIAALEAKLRELWV